MPSVWTPTKNDSGGFSSSRCWWCGHCGQHLLCLCWGKRNPQQERHHTGELVSAVKKNVLAVSAFITDVAGRVLLIQRGHEPAQGLWSVPGGSVEKAESLEEALVREMWEETRLKVVVGAEVWVATVALSPDADCEIHCFGATVTGGTLQAGDDAAAARFVTAGDYLALDTTPQLTSLLAQAGWPHTASASPHRR